MHDCMQKGVAGLDASCRTCAPIHHYSAEMLEAMGGKCGLMVNQYYQYGTNPVNGFADESFRRKGMHYVNICKIGGKFHLINYSRNYELTALTYQQAVDIANIGLAEGNWAGNQITCMESGKSSLKDCKHVYLSRSTRYQLGKIQTAIGQISDNQSPVAVALTNLSQEKYKF